MGYHNSLCLIGKGVLQLRHIDIILWNRHIHKHRHCAKLDSRGHRGWKPAGNRDDFISPFYPALPQQRGCQRHEGHQIGGGTVVEY